MTELAILVDDWLRSLKGEFWISSLSDTAPIRIFYNHMSYAQFGNSPTNYPKHTTFLMGTITEDKAVFHDLTLIAADPKFFEKMSRKFSAEIKRIRRGDSKLRIIGSYWASFTDIKTNSASNA